MLILNPTGLDPHRQALLLASARFVWVIFNRRAFVVIVLGLPANTAIRQLAIIVFRRLANTDLRLQMANSRILS